MLQCSFIIHNINRMHKVKPELREWEVLMWVDLPVELPSAEPPNKGSN